MDITSSNLKAVNQGFKSLYDASFAAAEPEYKKIAMHVPSAQGSEVYAWLGALSMIREWLGDRVINNIKAHDFTIKNKSWENTVSVPRSSIEDDAYGVYSPLFQEMGKDVKAHPDVLTFGLLASAFTTLCYDGQYLVDTDHPVTDANGAVTSVSNHGGGAGAAWFLIDDTRMIKPFIYQERRKFNFVALDNPDDPNVFNRDEFVYGVDGRNNAGVGLWQLIYGSKQTLDTANFNTAHAAMSGLKGDGGRPLRIKPSLLVVGPSNRQRALDIAKANQINGTTNTNQGTVEVLVTPYLI